ncbi:sensor histidine kinase [Clostridium novyi]|uniref:histidine kinase n=2 Tax=Clostridium novyi TaxID=1542 RepID=A0Q186_CLONN|nr:ATP-binding protein [Clostridium novyi]ABK61057.1 sensory transduction histidine kinase [Clostridium novyi NT]KEH87448.1 histidine kinase [Clostridium novyi A str. NCTC 538]
MGQVYDKLPFGVAIIDETNLNIKYMNRAFIDMFNIDADFQYKSLFAIDFFKNLEQIIKNCIKFKIDKKLRQIEILHKRYFDIIINICEKEVNIFFYEVSQYINLNSQLKNSNDSFLRMCSELKTKCDVLQSLRGKEKEGVSHLKNVLNNLSEGLIVYDEFGNFSFCNKAAIDLMGKEIKRRNFRNFFQYLNKLINQSEEIRLQELYYNYNFKHIPIKDFEIKLKSNENHKEVYIQLNSNYILKDNSIINNILTLKDITNIKNKEIKLQEQREFINDVVNTIDVPIAVIEFDDLKYKLINNKYREILKYNNNIEGKIVKEPEILNVINNVFTKDRCENEYIVAPYAIKDSNGNNIYYKIKFSAKISENNDINRLNRLFICAGDITEEITNNNELQSISDMKDEFFNMISHELRTPLTIINSSVQLARNVYKNEITDTIDKVLMRIDQNCRRLLKLINNILDISKAEAGFLQLEYSFFNIVSVTESIVSSVSIYAKSKEINLIFDTNEEEKMVALDKDKYEKIILNLLSNAIKFTPDNKNIYVTICSQKDVVKVKVKDEGVGIPKDSLDNIFNRFIQINNSVKNVTPGTGLGLALVKNFVELMNGNIKVNSKVNKGTEFTITFKVDDSNQKINLDNFNLAANIENKMLLEFSDVN